MEANIPPIFPIEKQFESMHLQIDIARTSLQTSEGLALRYRVFKEELGHGDHEECFNHIKHDLDEFDPYCDQLLITDLNTNKVVGTYRLLLASNLPDNMTIYSSTEFQLSEAMLALPNIAELGRSCIDPDYRNSLVIKLLWEGIAHYVVHNDIVQLCGCVSLSKDEDAYGASLIYQYCKSIDLLLENELAAKPLDSHLVEGFDPNVEIPDDVPLKRLIPPLFRGYLAMGGAICGPPAYDPLFDVIDFLMIFDCKVGSPARRHFGRLVGIED